MTPILAPSDFQEKFLRLNLEYADYLRDKTVCIVGRGGLEGMEQGEFIDSHDVVVRLHNMEPYTKRCKGPSYGEQPKFPENGIIMNVPSEWQSRIGSKCHILFFDNVYRNMSEELIRRCIEENEKAFRAIGGKFLCGESWPNHHTASEVVWQSMCDIRYLTLDHWMNTARLIGGSNPYAGTLIVTDILRHEVKRVYITGMPNFITKDNIDDPMLDTDCCPKNDLGFLVKMAGIYPDRVTIDDNMKQAWEYAIR